LEHLQEYI